MVTITHGRIFPARDGNPIEAVVPRGGSVYSSEVSCEPLENDVNVAYPPLMTLTGYELDETVVAPNSVLPLQLQWNIQSATDMDYRVFVQLIDKDNPSELLGSGDSTPKQTWYPSTSFVAGTCFNDLYTIQLMPDILAGEYDLLVGVYDANTGTRLNGQSDEAEYLLGGGYLITQAVTVDPTLEE